MVPKASLLLRGFAEALTFTGLVRLSFETGRADAFFAFLVAMLAALLGGVGATTRLWRRERQAAPRRSAADSVEAQRRETHRDEERNRGSATGMVEEDVRQDAADRDSAAMTQAANRSV